LKVKCGATEVSLAVRGKHTEIYHVVNGSVMRIEMAE
jgi:hypothetical protein